MNFLLPTLLFCHEKDVLPFEQKATAREAISRFLATIGEHPERTRYISFAETFALPELRAIASKLPEAQQQFSSYLAAFELFPEETAASLLTNGLLIDRLHTVENEERCF